MEKGRMKVEFFSQPYVLFVGDLPSPGVLSPLSGKRLRIHVVGWMQIKMGKIKAIAVLGWDMSKSEIHS